VNALTTLLDIRHPIIQAPMAGFGRPRLAAAVTDAGGLGSLALGAGTAAQAESTITALQALTTGPFNVNLFTHTPARPDAAREARWLAYLAPHFARTGQAPPGALREIYRSFLADPDMLEVLVRTRPAVVSFHFGLPTAQQIDALHGAGCVLMATATNPAEARAIEAAGIDIVVAQGYEAGGHRGMFDANVPDPALGTFALVRLLAATVRIPVVAAGGIMDGQGIAASMRLGASGAQMGTAFLTCPEAATSSHHRALLAQPDLGTAVTETISGRPARGLVNRFFAEIGAPGHPPAPDYPIAYDAAKQLHAAASAQGIQDYSVNWAGQAYALGRSMPAAELVRTLVAEMGDLQAPPG
jgi:nitronate monooxygenase